MFHVPRLMISLYYGPKSSIDFEEYSGSFLVGQSIRDSVLDWNRDSELMLVII